jgi:AraC-like DNA-binding protein
MQTQDARVDKVVAAVLESEGQLKLRDATEIVFLGPRRLRDIFRETTGTSFRTYRHRVRMRFALRLLRETTQTIDQIAESLGYSSRNKFERSFKRLYGMTPARARRIAAQGIYNEKLLP